LCAAILCWSSVPLFLRHFALTTKLDAWTVNGIRYGFAALLLSPCILSHRRRYPHGSAIWRDALVPAAVNTLGQIGWALAPYYLDAGIIGFGIRSSFLFAVLASFWLLPDERYLLRTPSFWAGAACCLLGIVGLFAPSLRLGGTSLAGTLILLGTAIVWGFYHVTVRKYMRPYPAFDSFAVICCYTAAALLVLTFAVGKPRAVPATPAPALALVLGSAALGIAMAHVCMYSVVRRLGALIASGAEFATPFITSFGAFLLFGEQMSRAQWCGGGAVICGSLLMVVSYRPQDRSPARKPSTRSQ